MSKPKRDVTEKMRPKTPNGAIFSAIPMMTTVTSASPSRSLIQNAFFSAESFVTPMPKRSAKKMTPSMSPFAAASTGLRGTMLTRSDGPNSAFPAVSILEAASPR